MARDAGAFDALGAGADDVRWRYPAQQLQRIPDHARDHHDLLRDHADPGRMLRQFPDPADDRRARHGFPEAEYALVLGRRGSRGADPVVIFRDWRTGGRGLDLIRAVERGAELHRRRLGAEPLVHLADRARRVVADGRDKLHHDHHQHAHQGHDVFPHAAGCLVAVHHRDPAAAGAAGAHHRAGAVAVRSDGGDALFHSHRRRRAAALAASVLVLRPSRGLHHDPARDGHHLGRHRDLFAQADFRVPRDGLCDDRDRVPVLDRVGPSHVPVGDGSGAGKRLHDHHDGHRGAVGDQDLQLAGHSL